MKSFLYGLACIVIAIFASLGDLPAAPTWEIVALWILGPLFTLKPFVAFLISQIRDKIHLRDMVWAYEAELMRHNIPVPTVPRSL